MFFNISHQIKYTYSEPIFVEPLTVRLRPRCNSMQRVYKFSLNIEPAPAGIAEPIDLDGNNIATVWFDGLHDSISVSALSRVEVLPISPFNYVVTEKAVLALPVKYSQRYWGALDPYVRRRYGRSQVDSFIQPIIKETEGQTMPFLTKLASIMHEQFEREFRETGTPMTPNETIAKRSGACRDLALLFMESCRAVGLAARYTSGYGYAENENGLEKRHMHAWVEVYLPGGGWRGIDPSIGLAVSDRHVAVAAAAEPADAAPTGGTFLGTGIRSELEYEVSISCSSSYQSSPDDESRVLDTT
jgi:transglutaminase-like putative cysteine protease